MGIKKSISRRLGVELPRLGFGMMRLPLKDGKIDREASDALVDMALANGVNYFDTAYPYHNGESEPYVGESLSRYPREQYMLATKLPTWLLDGTVETVERLFNEQLERCRVDFFDFYLIHAMSEDRLEPFQKCGAYEYLAKMKAQGKIKKLGFSFHGGYPLFKTMLDEYKWDFVQIQINYIDTEKIESGKLYDLLCERDIPCFVMEPVRGGFLANPPEEALKIFRELDGGKTSAASWAMRWCIDKENMAIMLSGMSSIEQLRDNLVTFDESAPDNLTDKEKAAIDKAREIILSIKTVPCTACRYCMDCPFGVDIPRNFGVYNDFMLFKNAFNANMNYMDMSEKKSAASVCTRCGACSPQCPQGIDIPERLGDVHEALSAIEL